MPAAATTTRATSATERIILNNNKNTLTQDGQPGLMSDRFATFHRPGGHLTIVNRVFFYSRVSEDQIVLVVYGIN